MKLNCQSMQSRSDSPCDYGREVRKSTVVHIIAAMYSTKYTTMARCYQYRWEILRKSKTNRSRPYSYNMDLHKYARVGKKMKNICIFKGENASHNYNNRKVPVVQKVA
jgi:hypothetical protein